MWLEGSRLQVIDTALETGRSADIDQLLSDILRGEGVQRVVPTVCPSCRRDLLRHPLPTAGLFVSRCPEGHGAWMDDSVVDALHQFVEAHASVAAQRRHQLRIFRRLLVVLALALVAAILFTYPERIAISAIEAIERVQDWRVSESYWPARGWMYKLSSIPPKESAIDAHEELAYFVALLDILDDGITHRININGVLHTRRSPVEYQRLYRLYRERQAAVLARLEQLVPPERLRGVHGRILAAAAEQIRFYERFMEAKMQRRGISLRDMLGDPALQTTNTELRTAWDEIRRLYPNLDPDSRSAIEGHFCGFDVL